MPMIEQLLYEPEIVQFIQYMQKCNLNLDYFRKVDYFSRVIYYQIEYCPIALGAICNDFKADCNEIVTGNCMECLMFVTDSKNCKAEHNIATYFTELKKLTDIFYVYQDNNGLLTEYKRK